MFLLDMVGSGGLGRTLSNQVICWQPNAEAHTQEEKRKHFENCISEVADNLMDTPYG